jgi:hypothetical protein
MGGRPSCSIRVLAAIEEVSTRLATNQGRFETSLVIGIGFGLYSFWKGFRTFREFRVVEDTPEIPIRSVSMGLVRVHGKADGQQQILSPVSRSSCFFYKVDIEKWEHSQKSSGWQHYRTDLQGVPFSLDDQTGTLVVDPTGAEYDIIKTAEREIGGISLGIGSSVPRSADGKPLARTMAGDDELRAYVGSGGRIATAAMLKSVLGRGLVGRTLGGAALNNVLDGMLAAAPAVDLPSGRYRLTEYCIQPGHWYDVTGTCTENPLSKDDRDRNLISKGVNEPTFLISWRTAKDVEKILRNRAALMIFGGGALAVACLGFLLAHLGML